MKSLITKDVREIAKLYPYHSNLELMERFGISRSTLTKTAKQNGWKKSRNYISTVRRATCTLNNYHHKAATDALSNYCPRQLVVEEVLNLLHQGYAAGMADLVKQRLAHVAQHQAPDWFERRMDWSLQEWIINLATKPVGEL